MIRRLVPLLLVLVLLAPSCANKVPPNLTPQATVAWYGTKAILDLDIVRDLAQAGNAFTPPVVSTETTRTITQFHLAAITAIHEAPNGWKSVVSVALRDLEAHLTATDKAMFATYLQLIWADMQAVTP